MTTMLSRKIAAALMGLTIAAGGVGSIGRAEAGSLTPAEAAAIAGLGGFIVGNIVGHAQHHHPRRARVVVVDSWDLHVARCEARYRTYDEASDTYVGFDGRERLCRL